MAPPVPIPNTEVKRCSPDGSTAIGRARVGRRQNKTPGELLIGRFDFFVPACQHTRLACQTTGIAFTNCIRRAPTTSITLGGCAGRNYQAPISAWNGAQGPYTSAYIYMST